MIVVESDIVVQSIVHLDTSTAFALNEHLFGLLKTIHNSQAFDYKLHDVYYEISEKLRKQINYRNLFHLRTRLFSDCGYSAYKISPNFQLENEVNQIIQRMIESGFTTAFKKWTKHIIKLAFNNYFVAMKDGKTPINLTHISGVLHAYMFGVVISFIALFGEILVKYYSGELRVEV